MSISLNYQTADFKNNAEMVDCFAHLTSKARNMVYPGPFTGILIKASRRRLPISGYHVLSSTC